MSTATRFAVLACLVSACGGVDAGTTPVENPAPTVDALDPDTVMVGGLPFTLTVHGAAFVDGAAVLWNDSALSSIYHQPSQISAVAAGRSVAPDSVAGRMFYLDRDASHLVACDLQTFATVGTPWVPVGSAFGFPRALRRWGTDGLAYTTGSQVIILRTTLATP